MGSDSGTFDGRMEDTTITIRQLAGSVIRDGQHLGADLTFQRPANYFDE